MNATPELLTVQSFKSYIGDRILIRVSMETGVSCRRGTYIGLYSTANEVPWYVEYIAIWNRYPSALPLRLRQLSDSIIEDFLVQWPRKFPRWCSVDQIVIQENDTCLPDREPRIMTSIPVELLLDFGRLQNQLDEAAKLNTSKSRAVATFRERLDRVLDDRLGDIRGAICTINSLMLIQ